MQQDQINIIHQNILSMNQILQFYQFYAVIPQLLRNVQYFVFCFCIENKNVHIKCRPHTVPIGKGDTAPCECLKMN